MGFSGTLGLGRKEGANKMEGTQWYGNGEDGQHVEKIAVARLDEIVKEPVYFMKMDIDGHEVLALEGAMGLIEKKMIRYIQLEFDPYVWQEACGHGADRAVAVVQKILDAGYYFHSINDPVMDPPLWTPCDFKPVIDGGAPLNGMQTIAREKVMEWVKPWAEKAVADEKASGAKNNV